MTGTGRRPTHLLIVLATVIASALGLLACGESEDSSASASPVALPSKPMSAADVGKVEEEVRSLMPALRSIAPALYLGIWDPQKGYFEKAYGNAIRNGREASAADSFRIGSITKTFTATVILQLVGKGKLELNGTVGKYDPELAKRFPPLKKLTIEQLLSMRSGIPDYLNVKGGIVKQVSEKPTRVWKPQELIAGALREPVKAPGTPGYSTTNFIVLQLIAEKLAGKSLRSLIAARLARPLDISATALPPSADSSLPAPSSHGYVNSAGVKEITSDGGRKLEQWTDTTDWSISYGQGGGGMTSTLRELGAWAASMSGNSLLPQELASKRLKTRSIGFGLNYGLGMMRVGPWYGHEGEAIGWEGIAFHNPKTGVTFVAQTNAAAGASELLVALMKGLYPA